MKDIVGNTLLIGDKVLYCKHRKSSNVYIQAEVIGFTDKMVHISTNYRNRLVTPSNCVVYRIKE